MPPRRSSPPRWARRRPASHDRQGLRIALRKLLRLRFGADSSPSLLARIEAADAETLDRWTERVLTATTAEDVVAG